MINPCAPLLPSAVIERARKLNVALLLDGVRLAKLDIPNGGCMEKGMVPAKSGMFFVGTAITVETADGDISPVHLGIYTACLPGYVLVIDGNGYEGNAYVGDLVMGTCKALGYCGIVVDGCIRDRDASADLDFPVYSKGYSPRGPVCVREGNVNVPVRCGGVNVAPGDLVMGDSDGVCVIPQQYIDLVLAKAEEKLAAETKRSELISAYNQARENGTALPQLAPQWVLDKYASLGLRIEKGDN